MSIGGVFRLSLVIHMCCLTLLTNFLCNAVLRRLDPVPMPKTYPFVGFPRSDDYNKVALDPNEKIKHKEIAELRRPYRILCLDGGGVRGALTTILLTRIVRHRPTFLNEVDFICGTSAGGILALMLGSGYSPSECHDLYTWAIPHIFGHNPWRLINPFRSKYSDKAKQELMQHAFGERTMADLEKSCAAVAFRLDGRKAKHQAFFHKEGWRPAVFSNIPKGAGLVDPDLELKVLTFFLVSELNF
jgi:hypothetical protein